MIKVRQLIYLRKAIKVGNLTQAAKELNVAQTALGIQIRNLEADLGVELLDRHSRGVVPTQAGLTLNAYADRILALCDEAREAMRPFASQTETPVRMGVTPSVMRLVGDDIVTELDKLIPDIQLHVVEDFSFILTRLVREGDLTCALTFSEGTLPGLQRRPLLHEDVYCLTAPEKTPEGSTVPLREVLSGDLALTGRDDSVSQLVVQLAQEQSCPLHIAYEVQSLRAVKNLVAKGIAATVMPYGAAEGELRSGVLKARLIVDPPVTRTLSFIYARENEALVASKAFTAFIDAVAQRLTQCDGPVMRLI